MGYTCNLELPPPKKKRGKKKEGGQRSGEPNPGAQRRSEGEHTPHDLVPLLCLREREERVLRRPALGHGRPAELRRLVVLELPDLHLRRRGRGRGGAGAGAEAEYAELLALGLWGRGPELPALGRVGLGAGEGGVVHLGGRGGGGGVGVGVGEHGRGRWSDARQAKANVGCGVSMVRRKGR
ncbi:hypothetical protein BD413DRAFT_166791 [Trametes elegans]|nr:hypothetical protein BD413DRAFT_166791 [Trametes elegans]